MKICRINNCNNKVLTKRLCNKHYLQIRRYGKTLDRTIFDPNEIIIKENHAEIVLYDNRGNEKAKAIIDIENINMCKKYKWYLSSKGYVINANNKSLRLHIYIMGFKGIDHKNRNKLDNRKKNLRRVTMSQNIANITKYKNKKYSSKYKGVFFNKRSNKWVAKIVLNDKAKWIGTFNKEEEAGLAYNKEAQILFGEFACLNGI